MKPRQNPFWKFSKKWAFLSTVKLKRESKIIPNLRKWLKPNLPKFDLSRNSDQFDLCDWFKQGWFIFLILEIYLLWCKNKYFYPKRRNLEIKKLENKTLGLHHLKMHIQNDDLWLSWMYYIRGRIKVNLSSLASHHIEYRHQNFLKVRLIIFTKLLNIADLQCWSAFVLINLIVLYFAI